VNTFAFSPGGTKIAAGDENHQVIIWDVESGEPLHTLLGHSDRVTGVSWSPDSHQVASVSNDGTLVIWNIAE
jgi:WD40 repeat protein